MPHYSKKPEYAPSYDPTQDRNHDSVLTKLGEQWAEIDTLIAPLVERINRFADEPVTFMSCQHDFYGWSNITFTYSGYQIMLKELRKQYVKKYGTHERGHCNDPVTGFYGRFINEDNCQIHLGAGEFYGFTDVTLLVTWTFDQKELPLLINEFDELMVSV